MLRAGMVEWREDLRRCLLQAGVKDTPTSFVFTDAQVVMESFLEDVNNILNAGVRDLGVPSCGDAFTPSTRVVFERGGRGWSLFRV